MVIMACVCRILGMINMLLLSRRADLRLISLDVDYFTDVSIRLNTPLQNAVSADLDPFTGQCRP